MDSSDEEYSDGHYYTDVTTSDEDWSEEEEQEEEQEEQQDEDCCYICYGTSDNDKFVEQEELCECRGTIRIHWRCFAPYRYDNPKCGICKTKYKISKVGVYLAQTTESYRKLYRGNGSLVAEGSFAREKKNGPWKHYHSNNIIEAEGSYIDSVRAGYWKTYNLGGHLSEEGPYVNGERSGYWKHYTYLGKIYAEGAYKNGTRFGHWKYYNHNKLHSEGKYIDGGLQHGLWKTYYPSGALRTEGSYVNHRRYGIWTDYFESGEIKQKYQYGSNGYLKCYHLMRYDSGAIEYEAIYENEKVVGYNYYDRNGTLIEKG